MAKKLSMFFLSAILFLILASPILTRPVLENSPLSSLNHLVSDGIRGFGQPSSSSYLRLVKSETETSCEEPYGFLPCTTTVVGNIFLIIVYGYLLFTAANFLCNGSEILMEILGPGLIGGLFLPILSCLPDAIIILASGLSATSQEDAQDEVLVGIGLLAGSTVMLLTMLWGSCVAVGKCDIDVNDMAIDGTDTKGFNIAGSGVGVDIWTQNAARIMAISIIPLVVVQLPNVLKSKSENRWAILAGLILSVCFLVSYCLYQVFRPWVQKRRIEFAEHKHVISGILKHLSARSLGKLFTHEGHPDVGVIKRLFEALDQNQDGVLSMTEIRALLVGIQFQEIDVDVQSAVEKIMADFDKDHNSTIDENEFIMGISRWLTEAKASTPRPNKKISRVPTTKYLDDFHMGLRKERHLLGYENGDYGETVDNPKWNTIKAVLMLVLGMAIAIAFADPLVNTVGNFSTASGIPSFFIAFVVLPLVCTSDGVSALSFVRQKKFKSASLTFCQIYGSVTMRNILSLAVFLGVIYFRQLTWDFYAEVLIILIVCVVMGVIASFRTTYPLWMALVAYALYPFSLLFVYVFHYVLGYN